MVQPRMVRMGIVAMAMVAAATAAAGTAIAATYQVTDLGANAPNSTGRAITGNQQAGYALMPDFRSHAFAWLSGPANPIDLHPAGFQESFALAAAGNMQGGYGTVFVQNPTPGLSMVQRHALLWYGSAANYTNLHPQGYYFSQIKGMGGNQQVGYGDGPDGSLEALMWTGSAASMIRLHPDGYALSQGEATDGVHQVGLAGNDVNAYHAMMWTGSAGTAVDLHPAGYDLSHALGVSGNQQVGYASGPTTGGTPDTRVDHAMLWNGSAADYIDLNPAGFTRSVARGVANGIQVGYGQTGGFDHALAWLGTPESFIDLHAFLPAGAIESRAYGISAAGNIVGYFTMPDLMNPGQTISHAAMWTPVPEPATLALLVLAGCGAIGRRFRW